MIKKVLSFAIILAFIVAFFSVTGFAAEKKVGVTVLPFSIYAAEDLTAYETDIQKVLLSALAYHEKIEPLDLDKLMGIVGDMRPEEMDENYARSVGSKMGADYVVLGSMTKVGDTISLDAKLVPVRKKGEPERFYIETYGLATVLDRVGDLAKKINEKIFYDEIIVKVIIRGNKRLSDEDLLGVVQSKEGTLPYEKFLAEDVKAITQMGYFEDVAVETAPVEGGTEVVFTVKERALVREVRVNGSDKIDVEDIFAVITVTPPEVLSIRELKESLEAIKDLYAEKQYHAATVDYRIEPIDEDEIMLEFNIDEGKRLMIRKIEFIGNDKISDREIEKGLANKSKGWIWWFTDRGKYRKEELDNDVERITAVYFDNGYLEAVVEPPDVEINKKGIYISYRISEGNRYRVGTVDVSGDLIRAKEEFLDELVLESGRYFSRTDLITDINYLVREYSNEGYALVDVQPLTDLDTEQLIANINYNIIKGKKAYFERINISGNIKTLDKVIRRELKFAEGDLFNGDDLERSQEKVNNLGYFEVVNFATERGSADDRVVVNIEVEEKPTGLISAGLGYSSVAEVTGMFRVQERNLFGRGYKVAAIAEFSSVDTSYSFIVEDPYFFNSNVSVSLRIYNITREYDTYDAETLGIEVGAGYPLWEETKLFVTYIFNDVNISDIAAVAPSDIWDYEGSTVTSGIEAILIRDTRNNIYDPTEGSLNSLSLFYAGIGGDENYIKGVAESSWYFRLFWKVVFHPRAQIGYIENLESGDIAVYNRFFAGGLNSLRGFAPYSVGPVERDASGNVIEYLGGTKEFIMNIEFIFPLFEDINMKGVVFFDIGNVWGEDEDWFEELRYSAGGGIRWLSPMGPIRVEWGYNLDPKEDEKASEWNFSVGTTF